MLKRGKKCGTIKLSLAFQHERERISPKKR